MNVAAVRASLLLAVSASCLVACGGGGGGGNSSPPPPPPPAPVAQNIAFTSSGPIDRILGDAAFTNAAAGGAGTGAITYSSGTTSVATVGATTGTVSILGVGTTLITANKAASDGFLAATASYTLNVGAPPPAPVAQIIAFADTGPVDKILGNPPFVNAASGGAGTGAISYSSSNTAAATVDANTGQVTLVATGVSTITATKAASNGYLAAMAQYILFVNPPPPLPQTLTFQNPGPVSITAGDPPLTNTASGGAGNGAITYSSSNTAVATVAAGTGQMTAISAGTAVITANKAASPGYLAATANYTVMVAAAPVAQTLTFDSPGPLSRTFGDPPFANWARGGAGNGAVTYESDAPSIVTVNATTGWVDMVGAGTAVITATKAASPGYLPATARYTLNVARAAQSISFLYPGPLAKRAYDNDFQNPASGGAGNGDVDYESSDTTVAMINGPRGTIHVMGVGSATITATKAQSANHLAASATYVIDVGTRPTLPMHVWLREDESLVKFPVGAVGAQWLRGNTTSCADGRIDSCPLAPVTTLTMQDINDTETELFTPGVYALRRAGFTTRPMVVDGSGYPKTFDNEVVEENGTLWSLDFNHAMLDRSNDGRAWTSASTAPLPYGPRAGATAVAFENRIFVIGGNQLQPTILSPAAGEKADVYQINPRGGAGFVTQSAAFGARQFHRVVSFGGKLWLIGGMRGAPAQYLNDIWSSSDGSTWTRVTAAAPFAPRAEHALAVFANRLWVIAGRNPSGYLDDAWSSFDGVTWQLESHFGNYGRAGHRAVVNNGRLYVIGRAEFLDAFAYSTFDGVTWLPNDSLGVPNGVTRFAALSFNNKVWMFGGTDQLGGGSCCARGEVWSTTDANSWSFENLSAPFSSMPGPNMWVFNRELYLTASSSHVHFSEQQPYKSSDGINWSLAQPTSPLATRAVARSEQVMLTHNNRLFLIGGRNRQPGTFNGSRSDVYSTADGSNWTLHTQHAFLERYGHSGYVINGRMFILGGIEDTPTQLGDIQSSADGTSWRTDVATSTNIGLRSYHQTVVLNGKVWLLGGQKNGGGVTGEIWSSTDGINWQLEKANEPATARMQFGATIMFNRIFIAGGVDANGNLLSDVWSSFDGVTWSLRTPAALPHPRAKIALAEKDNLLYLFGGESIETEDSGRGINEMWMSANGERWFKLYKNEIQVP